MTDPCLFVVCLSVCLSVSCNTEMTVHTRTRLIFWFILKLELVSKTPPACRPKCFSFPVLLLLLLCAVLSGKCGVAAVAVADSSDMIVVASTLTKNLLA